MNQLNIDFIYCLEVVDRLQKMRDKGIEILKTESDEYHINRSVVKILERALGEAPKGFNLDNYKTKKDNHVD